MLILILFTTNFYIWKQEKGPLSCSPPLDDLWNPSPLPKFVPPLAPKKFLLPHTWSFFKSPPLSESRGRTLCKLFVIFGYGIVKMFWANIGLTSTYFYLDIVHIEFCNSFESIRVYNNISCLDDSSRSVGDLYILVLKLTSKLY